MTNKKYKVKCTVRVSKHHCRQTFNTHRSPVIFFLVFFVNIWPGRQIPGHGFERQKEKGEKKGERKKGEGCANGHK